MCVHCRHELQVLDLIPLFSWLMLKGKCRYCHKPISWQYPLVEAVTAGLFVGSYIFWPHELSGWGLASFALWLVLLVGLVALTVYDLRWMLLPNRILFPLYGVAAAYVLTMLASEPSLDSLIGYMGGVLIGGGVFYLLFQVSGGKWIGGGDVKLGFLLGAVVGSTALALMFLFIGSFLGALVSVPLLLSGKVKRNSRIPFGPFLIASAIIVVLFGSDLVDLYLDVVFLQG